MTRSQRRQQKYFKMKSVEESIKEKLREFLPKIAKGILTKEEEIILGELVRIDYNSRPVIQIIQNQHDHFHIQSSDPVVIEVEDSGICYTPGTNVTVKYKNK